eukprot:gene33910-41828_t
MTTSTKSETAAKKDVTKLQRAIVDGLEDVKAQDIQVFNTEHLSPLFERVIVASGTSNRQTKALAASVRDAVKEAGFTKPRIEGEDNGEWIIVDCGAAVAHIMQPAIRQYYRLEELWGEVSVRLKMASGQAERLFCLVNAPACGDGNAITEEAIEQCQTHTFQHLRQLGLQLQATAANSLRTTPQDFHRRFPASGGALYGQATHGWTSIFKRPGASSALTGLYLAGGSVHPGPGVPMAALP